MGNLYRDATFSLPIYLLVNYRLFLHLDIVNNAGRYERVGFRVSTVIKNLPAIAGGVGLIPGSGGYPGGRNGNPLHYSCQDKPMDRGGWWAVVHGVTKSQTWLSDWALKHIQKSIDVSLRQWFNFLWRHTQKWNCWITWYFNFYLFWGTFIIFSIETLPIYIPTPSVQVFPFFPYILTSICFLSSFV